MQPLDQACARLGAAIHGAAKSTAARACRPPPCPPQLFLTPPLSSRCGSSPLASGMYLMGGGLAIAATVVAIYQPRWSEKRAMPNQAIADLVGASEAAADGSSSGGSVDGTVKISADVSTINK